MSQISCSLTICIVLWLDVVSSFATTYVTVPDDELVRQAAVIAVGRVLASEPSQTAEWPETNYKVYIEHLIKGMVVDNPLTVGVPGGISRDGIGLKIWGAPQFQIGKRVLLFLVPQPDGTFHVLHLMLGVFYEANLNGQRLAIRDLSDTHEILLPNGGAGGSRRRTKQPRHFERFVQWLAGRSAGDNPAADYFISVPPEQLRRLTEQFTTEEVNGIKVRWFEFDNGGGVQWRAYAGGQAGILGGAFEEFQNALTAWNDEPFTPVNYTYAGTTLATAGLRIFDGINTILFGDPNEQIAGSFNCATGGVLAAGGPWFTPQTQVFNGMTFYPILGADIVVQNGTECYFSASGGIPNAAAEEVFAHELGHTLGLGHACGDSTSPPCTDPALDDALMRAFAHNDGRGARLSPDDEAGVRFLYQNVASVEPLCAIDMPSTLYTGDAVSVSLQLANPGAEQVPVELKVWIEGPNLAPVSMVNLGADGTLLIPPRFDRSFPILQFTAGQAGFGPGAWALSCRMLDPVTGGLLAVDQHAFQIH